MVGKPWDRDVFDQDACWTGLDRDVRRRAIEHLQQRVPNLLEEVRELGWRGEHFFVGTQVRNLLREVIHDGELPSGNWDEYYVQALEAAAGVRKP